MTVSINPTAYVLRVHIGPVSELVFYEGQLLALTQFELYANGKDPVRTVYHPASVELLRGLYAPDDSASYETYPLRIYVDRNHQTDVHVSFKGRPVSAFHKVELILSTAHKPQVRLYHHAPIPDELREGLLDAKAELHEEPPDANV